MTPQTTASRSSRLPLLVAAVAAAAMALPAFDSAVTFIPIQRKNLQTENTQPVDAERYTRETLYFPCADVSCEAWLYLPKNSAEELPPVVILAHGLGGQKDMGLDKYASSFVKAGMAVFVFDYRSFGGSDGEPRNWVSPSRHVQDWHAAVAFVRTALKDHVDGARLALWGTSFAGGHVLVVGSQTPNVSAIISQVPHLNARVASMNSLKVRGIVPTLRTLLAGLLDFSGTLFGLTPGYVPLVGRPGSLAIMQLNEFETVEWKSKHPAVYQGGWQNLARASFYLEMLFTQYSPIKHVPSIKAPILFVAASNDTLCPYNLVVEATKLAPHGRLLSRDCTHFELYRGPLFEELVKEQVQFLQQALGMEGSVVQNALAVEEASGRGLEKIA